MKLVIFKDNYADEFDINGFQVMEDKDYKEWLDSLQEVEWPLEQYFGTNESIPYESYNEYIKCITTINLSEIEATVIDDIFGTYYGFFLDPTGIY